MERYHQWRSNSNRQSYNHRKQNNSGNYLQKHYILPFATIDEHPHPSIVFTLDSPFNLYLRGVPILTECSGFAKILLSPDWVLHPG